MKGTIQIMRRYKENIYLFFNLFSIEILMFIIFFYNRKIDMIYVNNEFVSYLFEEMYLSLTIFITEEMIFREGFFIILKNKMKYYNVVQAILFSIFHLNFIYFYAIKNIFLSILYSFITGMIYGNIRKNSKNVEVCIMLRIASFLSKIIFLKFLVEIRRIFFIRNNELIIIFGVFFCIYIFTLRKIDRNIYNFIN